jgi:hypothetical protein
MVREVATAPLPNVRHLALEITGLFDITFKMEAPCRGT